MALSAASRSLTAGTRVKVSRPGPVPQYSTCDDDGQRTSPAVKRRLQTLFFQGDKRVNASVVYVSSESVRDRLKAKGHVKVELRDPAGSRVVILAEVTSLVAA